MTVAWEPACLDQDELEALRAGAIAGCRDCTVPFAREMGAAGRCNGIPGEIAAGIAAEEDELDEATWTGSVAVSASAPCGGCAHAPVCRIRPAVEGLRSVAASLPAIDAAVTVALTAEVSCAHFARAKAPAHHATDPDRPKRQLSPEGLAKVRAANAARFAAMRAGGDQA